jgi:hypothetical protein
MKVFGHKFIHVSLEGLVCYFIQLIIVLFKLPLASCVNHSVED